MPKKTSFCKFIIRKFHQKIIRKDISKNMKRKYTNVTREVLIQFNQYQITTFDPKLINNWKC